MPAASHKHGHLPVTDDHQSLFFERVEPGNQDVSLHPRRELEEAGRDVGDLIVQGKAALMFTSGWLSIVFWAEIVLFAFPLFILTSKERRSNFPTMPTSNTPMSMPMVTGAPTLPTRTPG